MKWPVISTCAFLTIGTLVHAGPPSAADIKRKQAEAKAAQERRAAEMKRKHDQDVKELKSKASLAAPSLTTPSLATPSLGSKPLLPKRQAKSPVPSFNPASAPRPEDCLKSYVMAARGAGRMEDLLRYLPASERRSLEGYQATYDPKQAEKNRQWHQKQSPNIDKEGLTFLSNSPYKNELDRQRRIANKILSVLDTKVEGNKATIQVSTTSEATINGKKYPYGIATIEMVGEDNFWKMSSYNDSIVHYLEPPMKP